MRFTRPHHRVMGSVVLACLLVGCAVAPVVPNGGLFAPSTEAPSPGPDITPSAMPFVEPDPPCDPEAAPWTVINDVMPGQKAQDYVLLGRCKERFVQRVGRSPEPLPIRIDDFGIEWLAPDASYALGIRHATPASPNVPSQLIKRFADGRADHVLHLEPVNQVWVSPGGQTIAIFTSGVSGEPPEPDHHLSLMRTETGEVRQVAASKIMGGMAQWSPDGDRLVFRQLHPEVQIATMWSVELPKFNVAWTSWAEPTPHRLPGNAAMRYDLYHRGMFTWAPDSRHLLVYDQDEFTPEKVAKLVTLDFAGKEVSRPIVGVDGKPTKHFGPRDIAAGNRLLFGHEGLLDVETGHVTPFSTEGLLRWSQEPGKLLRWRVTSEGPVLDTVDWTSLTP